jgi:hypothetical protein
LEAALRRLFKAFRCQRSHKTPQIASHITAELILERPAIRSVKTIGTSTSLAPAKYALYLTSI